MNYDFGMGSLALSFAFRRGRRQCRLPIAAPLMKEKPRDHRISRAVGPFASRRRMFANSR